MSSLLRSAIVAACNVVMDDSEMKGSCQQANPDPNKSYPDNPENLARLLKELNVQTLVHPAICMRPISETLANPKKYR